VTLIFFFFLNMDGYVVMYM